MKKIITLLILFFGVICQTWAKPVTEAQALLAGQNFMRHLAQGAQASIVLQRVFPATLQAGQNPVYFVFSPQAGNAFVMVAGDDASLPILGYSYESAFVQQNVPEHIAKWFENYKEQILHIRANNLPATSEITAEWTRLTDANGIKGNKNTAVSVSPLLTTKWNQSPHYNDMCPWNTAGTQRTVTGCVATAMAQVMKYHNHPAQGTGIKSYTYSTSSSSGTLSANFGATTYNWGAMPNQLTSANSAIATLMLHCGIGVDMQYGVASQGGSTNYDITKVGTALKNYFKYDAGLQYVEKIGITQTNWINLIKVELTASRPVAYRGQGTGGHLFVADGYDASNNFHINWGWGGSQDGYFAINALNPGTYHFNNGQGVFTGVKPIATVANYNLKMYNNLSLSNATINVGQAFSVTGAVANYGAGSFSGDYCAGLFNSTGTFIGYVGNISTLQTTNAGFWQSYNFASTGIPAATPGTYTINFFYRPTGGNWEPVATGNGGQQNAITLTVTNNADIRLWTGMTLNPNPIIKGNSFTVSYQIANFGATAYNGDFQTALHDFAGNYISTVQMYTGQFLGSTSFGGTTVFTGSASLTSSLVVGNYQIVAWFKPTSSSTWQLMGGNGFGNPINISIVNPPIFADGYETNNTVSTAYPFFPSFSANSASVYTWGSTLHTDTDYDYYRVSLPAGYTYTITPRVHDSYNAGNGGIYSCDVMFGYKIGTTTPFLEAYDTSMPSPITVVGGGDIFFYVSPYFQGMIGSYLLDVQISRTAIAPDEFENNNTEPSAYTLTTTFTTNTLEIGTVINNFSNLHTASDQDYYKVSLPSGWDYTINANMVDAYNNPYSSFGLVFSADAKFAQKAGASGTYSANFNATGTALTLTNGGEAYFWVQSQSGWETGEYLLVLNITRTPRLNILGTTSINFFRATSTVPSFSAGFNIVAENVTNAVDFNLSTTDWEMSFDNGATWQASYSVTPNGSYYLVSPQPLVRLKAGLSVGVKTANINISSTGLPTKTIALNGEVIAPIATTVTVDNTFNVGTGFSGTVIQTTLQTDGKIIAVGSFTAYNNTTVNRIVRLNADGSLDNTFSAGTAFDATVRSLVIQPDGKVIVAGHFANYNGTTVNRIVRLNSNGTIDNTFSIGAGFDAVVYSLALQPDGKIIAGGAFTNYAGNTTNRIARLNSNGTFDATFATGTGFSSSYVFKVALQTDGKVIAAGSFYSYNGTNVYNIARLNTNGSLDNTFSTGLGFNSIVYNAVVQPDGKVLIAGEFTSFNGTVANKLARLNSNGALDTNFTPNVQASDIYVVGLELQSNGKIIVGGIFEDYAGTQMNNFVRLQSNGTTDNTFNTGHGAYGLIWQYTILPDGKILANGGQTLYNANSVSRLTRFIPPAPQLTASTASISGFNTSFGVASASQNFTLSATNISSAANISINTTDWELSTNNTTWTSALSIAHVSGDLPTTTIYVRLKAGIVSGAKTATLTCSSTGANSPTIALNGTVTKIAQTITFNALPAKFVTDAPFVVNPTSTSGLTVNLSSSNPAVATISGNTITIVGAGNTDITATQGGDTNYDPAVPVVRTLTVNKLTQTITFATLPTKFIGDAPFVVSPTASSNLPVTLVSSNSAVATVSGFTITIVGGGTTNITASQGGNAQYAPATDVVRVLTVTKNNQTITFGALANKTFGDAPFSLGAIASSSLTVNYVSSNTNVITISGNTATIVGAGNANITASQDGNSAFNPATSITQAITVNKANQTITFDALAGKTFGDAPFNIIGSASSGLAVSFISSNTSVATVVGNTVTIVGVGSTVFTASQSGNANYNPATNVTQGFTVGKANQTITFNALPPKLPTDAPFSLNASASSGLAVTYISSNPSVATISGNLVTLTGGTGSANITASQAGSTNYNPAQDVVQVLNVGKQNQTITFPAFPTKRFGDIPFVINVSASSGLALTFQSSNPAVATVFGNTITIVGVGSAVIMASQAGNVYYYAATDATQVLTVGKGLQTITFPTIADKVFGESPFALGATSSAGLDISYSLSTVPATGVATLSNGTLTIVGVGSVSVIASQAGNTLYESATNVTRTFQVVYPTSVLPAVTVGELIVYPNPSRTGMFEVRGLQSLDKQSVGYTVVDASGKVIRQGTWAGKDTETLNLSQAVNATYILHLRGSEGKVSRKIVKQ